MLLILFAGLQELVKIEVFPIDDVCQRDGCSKVTPSVPKIILPFQNLSYGSTQIWSDTIVVVGGVPNSHEHWEPEKEEDLHWRSDCSKTKKRKRPALICDGSTAEKISGNPLKTILCQRSGSCDVNLHRKGARSVGEGCAESCRQRCHSRISVEARREAFQKFWASSDKVLQRWNIHQLVRPGPVKRRTITCNSGSEFFRKFSYQYYLPSADGILVPVCQKMFLSTLNISKSVVKIALKTNIHETEN